MPRPGLKPSIDMAPLTAAYLLILRTAYIQAEIAGTGNWIERRASAACSKVIASKNFSVSIAMPCKFFDCAPIVSPRVFSVQRCKEPSVHPLPTCYTPYRKTTHVMLGFAINGKKDLRKKSKHNWGDAEG